MMKFKIAVVIFFISVFNNLNAENAVISNSLDSRIMCNQKHDSIDIAGDTLAKRKCVQYKNLKKEKVIAAICAFPFPFGFVGTHRVMLGTKPWIPVVYVATFGGCFGLIPLIDFFVIVFNRDDMKSLENNPKVFMWTKDHQME